MSKVIRPIYVIDKSRYGNIIKRYAVSKYVQTVINNYLPVEIIVSVNNSIVMTHSIGSVNALTVHVPEDNRMMAMHDDITVYDSIIDFKFGEFEKIVIIYSYQVGWVVYLYYKTTRFLTLKDIFHYIKERIFA